MVKTVLWSVSLGQVILSSKMTEEDKTVIVELFNCDGTALETAPREVTYSPSSEKSDLTLVKEKLLKKSKTLNEALMASTCVFQIKNLSNPSASIEIGEDSPLKNGSVIKCVVTPLKPVPFRHTGNFC